MSNEKWLEDFYKYVESNIRGYKRPTDYKERLGKVKSKKRYPATEGDKRHEH